MGKVSGTAASIRISGDDLDPEEITRLLGSPPERAYRRGEAIALPNGGSRTARTGRWSVSADGASPGDLDAQLMGLLANLNGDLAVWRDLASRYTVEAFCGLFVEDGNQGLTLSPTTLRALADRSISMDLDICARN